MITQKEMKEWYPKIADAFLKAMPPISRSLPELVIVTKTTWEKKRASLIERLQSNQVEPDGTGAMETIHGVNGDAILVYQHMLGSQVNNYTEFRHCIWHELGHFYAINSEDPSFNRFMDQQPHPDEYEALRGYYFWAEFIAEKTACDLEPEVEIDWSSADYRLPRSHIKQHLFDGLKMVNDMTDWYWLSLYFAEIISDKVILGYLNAVKDGTLKYSRSYFDEPIPFRDSGIDPLCFDLVDDEGIRMILKDMKGILTDQINEDNPYGISLDTLCALGEGICNIEMHNKMNEYKRRLGIVR